MNTGVLTGFINGTEQVVFDYEVTGSAVESISTGNILNGDVDGIYRIITSHKATGGTCNLQMRLNNDAGTNYGFKGIYADGTSVTDNTTTGAVGIPLTYATLNRYGFSESSLYAKSGAVRLQNTRYIADVTGTTVALLQEMTSVWNSTASNITNIMFYNASGGLRIDVGSRLIILKPTVNTGGTQTGSITTPKITNSWVRVGSNTLGSAATTSSFTGLSGNTAVCYLLTGNLIGGSATIGTTTIKFNSDGGSNYGFQFVRAVDTTVAGSRSTGTLGYLDGNGCDQNRTTQFSTYIYAKSGFPRLYHNKVECNIVGQTVSAIYIYGQSWNNTADEMTRIDIVSSQTNGLGAGSVFNLYALYT